MIRKDRNDRLLLGFPAYRQAGGKAGMTDYSGFTLVELLVVVTLTVILAAVSIPNLADFFNEREVELTTDEVAAALREAQKRSVTQRDGSQWGMRFTNGTSTDTYDLFVGSSYVSSSVVNSFKRGVVYGEPTTGTSTDITFSKISGKTSGRKIVTLMNSGGEGSSVGDIMVDAQGRITARILKNIAGYWHFDEGSSSTVYDVSSYGNNGSVIGASWTAASSCQAGRCLSFNGSSNYVTASSSDSLTVGNNFSITAWAKPTALSGTQDVVTKWASGSYWFLGWSGSTLQFSPSNDEANAKATYSGGTANAWNFIAGTYDGATSALYLNGQRVATKAYTGGTDASSGNVGIGARPDGTPTNFFGGLIDEVRIYNKTLSAQDILDIYNDFN